MPQLDLTTPFLCCEDTHTVTAFEVESYIHSPSAGLFGVSPPTLDVKVIAVTQCGDGRIRKAFRIYDADLIDAGFTAGFTDQWLLENIVNEKFAGVYNAE